MDYNKNDKNHSLKKNILFAVQNKYVQDLWQSKSSSNISLSEEMLNIFSLHGRLIHYCLTPLLFMPSYV